MIKRFILVIIGFCFSFQALSQSLTISNATNSSSNWSFSGGVLTVSGTANIQATQIQTWLGSGDLSIVGSTSVLTVNVNEVITSTTVGSDLTIGSATNNGVITLNSNLSIAGGLVVRGSDIQINSNITSTATGDLFFQGLSDSWSVRLASGKIIEKTAGTGLLTFQGNGRINNHVNVGSILASGSAQLDVVMIAEMDQGTAGPYNISTGNISTNGGKIWIGAGPKTRVWNGFSVGSTGVPGNTTANGIEITGNISSNGGDMLLWSFLGSQARTNGYGDIVAEGANRTINAGSGDIILMTRYNDFVDDATILTVNTTGALILTPASSANFDVAVNFSGTSSTGTFTGSGGLAGLIITNFTSLSELMVGSYNGTGISGDTPFVFANTADFNLNSAISLAAKVSFYGGDINLNQSINTTGAAALGDVLCKASGDIILAASRSITTSGGDVILWANSDNQNSLGSVALRSSSAIVTGSNSVTGGHVWIGGGSNGGAWNGLEVGAGYAVPGTGFDPPTGGGGWAAGVFFESCSITTFGGDVKILGDAASSGRGLIYFGTVSIHTNAGEIEIVGNATNSALTAVNGILFGLHDISTIGSVSLSSSASGTAITISGFGRGTENAIGVSGSVTAQSTGTGNIVFNGTSYGTGTAIKVGNFYHGILNAYAASGSVTFNCGTKGLEVASAQNTSGLTTGPSKLNIGQGGSVANSSSNVILTGDVISSAASGIAILSTGNVTIQPSSNSFTNALTFSSPAFSVPSTVSGLTIGKSTNTAAVTIGSNQSVSGNIDIYAGTLTLNANLTSTNGGDISLYSNNALAGLSVARTINAAGVMTYAPQGISFGSAVTYPIPNLMVSSNGLTLGKTGNTADLTIGAATSVNGPITLFGGTLALNNALTTTNTSTGNLSLNGTTLSGSSTLTVANGRTLTMNLSSNTSYTGSINGNNLSFVKNGAGMLTLPTPTSLSFTKMTISGGTYRLNVNQQLTLSDTLVNNGTFLVRDGATFVQATSGTSVAGSGTFTVQKYLSDNSPTWSTTSGRFWYMGVPMVSVARSSYGTPGTTTNRVWSYSEASKSYTELSDGTALLSAGTGYVHRRSSNDTLTYSATGANGLYGSDYSVSGLTKTAGYTSGVNLVSNPYMGYLDWNAVYNASTNIDPTFYIRSNNTTSNNINALITYNASTNNATNTSSVSNTSNFRYIAPMQSIWVKVGAAASTGTVNMNRSMLSHQTGNALKSSTVFPTLARVNLVDGNQFDQLLVYMNGDMSNEVDQYDSEKFPVSGTVQIYTMASNKKLVMNGLKNNKKKVSVPLYLELPTSKSYTLNLSEYVLDNGLILLEDKQEGTMQDLTLLENYTFYANSGTLQNRFVLHFILPDAEFTNQGPSNSWVGPETSYTEGGDVQITNDDRGNIQITVDQPEDQKVEGTVSVTDMNGKEVYKGQLDGITTAVELNVPAGIYYLTVQSGVLFEKKKVFIQN